MATGTKEEAQRSFFVFVQDTNTGKIKRLAIPGDVQIGLQGNPAELQLLGRLSLAATDYSITSANKGILYVANDDTIVSVTVVDTPPTGRVTLYLPANPRNGQLHFVKDMSGTADTIPVDIVPSPGALIDQYASQTLTDKFGSIALYWFGDRWRILVSGLGLTNLGAAPIDAPYLTLAGVAGLTGERRLNLSGTNLTMTDFGANASCVIDLSAIMAGNQGTYTYSTVTVDSYGRITAISNGTPPPPTNASYITVTNEPGLSAERALTVGSGLLLNDGGANAAITASINNNVVATLSGSRFTGPVRAAGGLSGSLQQLDSGISYLVAGPGITVFTSSQGQVLIGSLNPWTDGGSKIFTTSSVSIDGQGRFADALGTDVYLFVSGTIGIPSGGVNARRVAVFGGDVRVSGSLTVGSGSVTVTSNDIQFGTPATKIERGGADLKFFDVNNPTGYTLTQLAAGGSGGTFSVSSVISGTAYQGHSTGVFAFNATTWTDFLVASDPSAFTDALQQGITRSGSTFTVSQTGLYNFHSHINTERQGGFVAFRLSGSNGTLLQHTHFDSAITAQSQGVAGPGFALDGIVHLNSGASVRLQYVVKAGTNQQWDVNNPIDGEIMRTAAISMFLIKDPITVNQIVTQSGGWVTVYDQDFASLPVFTASNGNNTFGGQTWAVENRGNADWMGVTPGEGLIIDTNSAVSDNYLFVTRTSPLFFLTASNILPADFNWSDYEVRLWMVTYGVGASSNFEIKRVGFNNTPHVPGQYNGYFLQEGFSNGPFRGFTAFVSGSDAGFGQQAGDNVSVLHLKGPKEFQGFTATSSLGNFPDVSALKAVYQYTTASFIPSPWVSPNKFGIEFHAYSTNADNTWRSVLRRIKVEVFKKTVNILSSTTGNAPLDVVTASLATFTNVPLQPTWASVCTITSSYNDLMFFGKVAGAGAGANTVWVRLLVDGDYPKNFGNQATFIETVNSGAGFGGTLTGRITGLPTTGSHVFELQVTKGSSANNPAIDPNSLVGGFNPIQGASLMLVNLTQSVGGTSTSGGGSSNAAPHGWTDGVGKMKTTGSVSIDAGNRYADAIGNDVFFFVSGTIGIPSGGVNARRVAAFGGDVHVSGSLTVGSSPVTITGNNVQFSDQSTRIERSGNDLTFYDTFNPTGRTLSSLIAAAQLLSGTSATVYNGYGTGSLTWGNGTAWADFTTIVGNFTDTVQQGIIRSGSTWTVTQTGQYHWHSDFGAIYSAGYLAFRLSGSNGTLLQYTSTSPDAHAVLDGIIQLNSGASFKLQFVRKAGTGGTWNVSDPIGSSPDTENMRTAEVNMFLIRDPVTLNVTSSTTTVTGGGGGGIASYVANYTTSSLTKQVSVTSSSWQQITETNVTLTTDGGAVLLTSNISALLNNANTTAAFTFLRNGADISQVSGGFHYYNGDTAADRPASVSMNYIDTPPRGTYTYSIAARIVEGAGTARIGVRSKGNLTSSLTQLVATELPPSVTYATGSAAAQTTLAGSYAAIPNLSGTINVAGTVVLLANLTLKNAGGGTIVPSLSLFRDSTNLGVTNGMVIIVAGASGSTIPSNLTYYDTPTPGTYTYSVRGTYNFGGTTAQTSPQIANGNCKDWFAVIHYPPGINARQTTSTSNTSIAGGTFAEFSNLRHSLTTAGRPVLVGATMCLNSTTAPARAAFTVFRNGVQVGGGGTDDGMMVIECPGNSANTPATLFFIDNPPAGSHTYSVASSNLTGSHIISEVGEQANIFTLELPPHNPASLNGWIDGGSKLKTTSSVAIDGLGRYAADIGADTYFFVSGTIGVSTASNPQNAKVAAFGGDVRISGSLRVGSGSVAVTSNDIQFSDFSTRIERQGNDLKFYDVNNPAGKTLTNFGSGGGTSTSTTNLTGSGWQTALDINFATSNAYTFVDGLNSVSGVNYYATNVAGAADQVAIVPGDGLRIDPNATATDWYLSVRSAPHVKIKVKDLIPDYSPTDYQLRAWVAFDVFGADQNYELASFALDRFDFVSNQNQGWRAIRGFNNGGTPNFGASGGRGFNTWWGGTEGGGTPLIPTSNIVQVIHLRNPREADLYSYNPGNDHINFVWPATTALTWSATTRLDPTSVNGPNFISGSGDLALIAAAYPVNTANAFSGSFKRIKLEYLKISPTFNLVTSSISLPDVLTESTLFLSPVRYLTSGTTALPAGVAGNFTVGTEFYPTNDCKVRGVRFWYPSGSVNIRATLWSGSTALATSFVNTTQPGVYNVLFSSSILLTGSAMINKSYYVSVYQTNGLAYTAQPGNTVPFSLTLPTQGGADLYWTSFTQKGVGNTAPLTNSGSIERFPVEPIIEGLITGSTGTGGSGTSTTLIAGNGITMATASNGNVLVSSSLLAGSPADFPGLVGWYEAVTGSITLDGTGTPSVREWRDLSSASNHFGMVTKALQPIWYAANPDFGGVSSVDFQAAHVLSSSANINLSTFTAVFLVQVKNTNSILYEHSVNVNAGGGSYVYTSTSDTIHVQRGAGTPNASGKDNAFGTTWAVDQPYPTILVQQHNGTQRGQRLFVRNIDERMTNGANGTADLGNAAYSDRIYLGARANAQPVVSPSLQLSGSVVAMAFYTPALRIDQVYKVMRYFSNKFNVGM